MNGSTRERHWSHEYKRTQRIPLHYLAAVAIHLSNEETIA